MGASDGPVRDTIVASASVIGRSAVSVVRWSGPDAFGLLDVLTPGAARPVDRRAVLRTIRDPRSDEVIDEGLVTCFAGPASYTGEDVVEFSGHGGALTPHLVIDAVVAAGARRAEPGEFTRRAYLLGRIDLVQAEAVQAVIDSRSRSRRRAALHQISGTLSDRIVAVRESLIDLEAHLAHHVDFPEEDDAPVPVEQLLERAHGVEGSLKALAESAPVGGLATDGELVVLAGRPNTGKSSLFNALLGEQRALVTDEAGTTRDAVSVELDVDGHLLRLIDTAGLREGAGTVEQLGIEVARRYASSADVLVFCLECERAAEADEREFISEALARGQKVVIARTMSDRVATTGALDSGVQARPSESAGERISFQGLIEISISAHTGQGLGALKQHLKQSVTPAYGSEAPPALMQERQRLGVARALDNLRGFIGSMEAGVPAEIAALDLRSAREALEEMVGVIASESVLDRLFSSFCIGK